MNKAIIFDFNGVILDSFNASSKIGSLDDISKPLLFGKSIVPGIDKAILELSKKYILTIISSSYELYISETLLAHNLEKFFAEIKGFDGQTKKEKIIDFCQTTNTPPENCLYITDSLEDIREAQSANVRSLAVTWGLDDVRQLQRGKPYATASSPDQIIAKVNEYFSQK